jgi:hypothetical protein
MRRDRPPVTPRRARGIFAADHSSGFKRVDECRWDVGFRAAAQWAHAQAADRDDAISGSVNLVESHREDHKVSALSSK